MARKKQSTQASKPVDPAAASSTALAKLGYTPLYPFDLLFLEEDTYHVLVSLDPGTSKIEVAYAVAARNSSNPFAARIEPLAMQLGYPSFPALMAVQAVTPGSTDRAELLIGTAVETALKFHSISHQHVVSIIKQSACIMNPDDPVFQDKREALLATQHKHEAVLRYAQEFDEIMVRFQGYGRNRIETYSGKQNQDLNIKPLNSVEDLFVVLLSWTRDYIKSAFHRRTGFPGPIVDELFEGGKVQFGVAVPDCLPVSAVTKYHQILIRSGFGDNVEMISEARCAAVKVARDHLAVKGPLDSLGHFNHKDIDVVDIGHGTTDISTIRAVKNGATLQLKFVVDSIGDATGGKVIEDHMINAIQNLFRNKLQSHMPRDKYGNEIEEAELLDNFRLGVAEAKLDFAMEKGPVTIIYYGVEKLNNPGRVDQDYVVGRTGIIVPASLVRAAYDEFLEPIIRVAGNTTKKKGLLERHYKNLKDWGYGRKDRFPMLVGNASIPEYVQSEIQSAWTEIIQKWIDPPPNHVGRRLLAHVAEGGIFMLNDHELRERRFHNESLGCIVKLGSADDLKAGWFFKICQQITTRPVFEHKYDYNISLYPGENPFDPSFQYPLEFEWQFVRTADETVGKQDYPSIECEEIRRDQGIRFDMDKDLCKRIGWKHDENKIWRLDFKFVLNVELRGQVIRCKVTIPLRRTSARTSGNVEKAEFNVLMTADLSHMCHEDLFEMKKSRRTARA